MRADRRLAILAIRMYQRWPKPTWGPKCLLAVSCSRAVADAVESGGLNAGFRLARARWKQCRPGYSFRVKPDGMWSLECIDGSIVEADDTSVTVRFEALAVCAPVLGSLAVGPSST